jgi:hypothetical protein
MVNRRQLLKLSALSTASFAAPLAYSTSKMTITYNTGNPIASTSPKDLHDNAQSLDLFMNGADSSYPDRLGVPRRSWRGMESDFSSAQADKEERFQQFLLSSGYQPIGEYGPGLPISERNQIFLKDGEFYRAGEELILPYTTTGVWADESAKFVSVGDAVLRQELACPEGSTKIGFLQGGADTVPRSSQDKMRDTSSVKDFGASGAGDDTASFIAAGPGAAVPDGMFSIDPKLVDLASLSGPGSVLAGGNIHSLAEIADHGVIGQRKLATLLYGDDIGGPVIYQNAQNALQGVAFARHNGVDRIFISQQVSGSGFTDVSTRTRITEFKFTADGSDIIPVAFTDPLPLSHGSDLSAFVENGELYLFTTSTAEFIGTRGGKGYSKVKWNGAVTNISDIQYFYLVGEPGDSNPINGYQSGSVAVSTDGKLIVMIFTSFYGTGRFLIVWDRAEVEACANPRLVRPLFGPSPIERAPGEFGSTMQGLASDGRHVYTIWGLGAPGAARTIQTYTLGAELINSFPVALAAALYTDSELKGSSPLGVPVSFEPEGLTIIGDELVCTGLDAWKAVSSVVSYKGYNWASTSTASNTGIRPTNRSSWLRTLVAANAGEWVSTGTYPSGAYTKHHKHLFGIARLSAAKGNKPIQGSVMDAPTGTIAEYYAGTDIAYNLENGSFTIAAFEEALGTYIKALELNFGNSLNLFDTSVGAQSHYASVRSVWTGNQWGLQLRSKNGQSTSGAFIDLISTDSPNGAGEVRVSGVGGAGVRLQVDGATMFAAAATESIFYGNERPLNNNVYSKGTPSRVYTTIYLQTAPVVSSDARLKAPVRSMGEAEIAIGRRLARELGFYKWLCSIDEKGGADARWHVGMTVQSAIKIFEEEELDPFEYGAICHDVWGDEFETVDAVWLGTGRYKIQYDEAGKEIAREEIMEKWADAAERQTLWAGDKFSFREGELHGLMIRALAYDQDQINERLLALEGR